MTELGTLWNSLTTLAGVALRSFLLTVVGMFLLGVVLAGVSGYLAADGSWVRGAVAAALAVLVSTVAGFLVAGQRATAVALMCGLRNMHLGQTVVKPLFARLLGITDEGVLGQRGNLAAQAVERVPLAQAETRLRQVIDDYVRPSPDAGGLTGWFRRRLQARLLRGVEQCTLAQLRQHGTAEGGIDLVKARADLENRIDRLLLARVRSTAVRLTALTVAVTILVVVTLALAIQRLPL